MQPLGVLKEIDPRAIWPHEAQDFTPWLAEHIDELGEVLGLDLEITEREGAVGSYTGDLVGRDLGSGNMVVIENQLERTDHSHLGQLLTYAAGLEASIVIWMSPQFTEEHRQALDWLNEITGEKQAFFGVEIRVVQIDDSKPAPLFKLVAQPNEWQKSRAQTSPQVSARGEAYRKFWTAYLAKLKSRAPGLTRATKGQPQNCYYVSGGRSGISCGASFTSHKQLKVELYIDLGDKEANKQLFDRLHQNKETIEQELGAPLSWERLDNARASRIVTYRPGTIEAPDQELEELQDWAAETVTVLVHAKRDAGVLHFYPAPPVLVKKAQSRIPEFDSKLHAHTSTCIP